MQDLYKKEGGGGSILDFDLHASGCKTLGLLCQETYIVGQGGGGGPPGTPWIRPWKVLLFSNVQITWKCTLFGGCYVNRILAISLT